MSRLQHRFAARAYNLCCEAEAYGFVNSGWLPPARLDDDHLQVWVATLLGRCNHLAEFLLRATLVYPEAAHTLNRVRRLVKDYRRGHLG
jgi:hypothetical protein